MVFAENMGLGAPIIPKGISRFLKDYGNGGLDPENLKRLHRL